jgi:hypothetical protein
MKTYTFLFIFTFIGFFSKAEMATSSLAITSVHIQKSNASLGPHNKVRTWTLGVSNDEFKALSQKVMKESKLNAKYSLVEYFKNIDSIPKRKPKVIKQPQPKGADRSSTTLYFNNGQKIEFNSYYDYDLSAPFDQLVRLTKTKGVYEEYKANSKTKLRPQPVLNIIKPHKIKTH